MSLTRFYTSRCRFLCHRVVVLTLVHQYHAPVTVLDLDFVPDHQRLSRSRASSSSLHPISLCFHFSLDQSKNFSTLLLLLLKFPQELRTSSIRPRRRFCPLANLSLYVVLICVSSSSCHLPQIASLSSCVLSSIAFCFSSWYFVFSIAVACNLFFLSQSPHVPRACICYSSRNILCSIQSSSFFWSVLDFSLVAMCRIFQTNRTAFRDIGPKENHPPTWAYPAPGRAPELLL